MAELKNVIEHLKIIRTWAELDGNMGCGMEPKCCLRVAEWVDDALGVLKEQEPRVMTLEEVLSLHEGDVVWFEELDHDMKSYIQPMMSDGKGYLRGVSLDIRCDLLHLEKRRFWSSRPTNQQRKDAKWE